SFVLTLNTTLNSAAAQCSKTVTVKALPSCDIAGSSMLTEATTGNTYTAPPNLSSYNWSISGANGSIIGSSAGQTVSVTAGAAGGFTLTLNVTLNGCTSSCSKTVTVNPSTTLQCSVVGAAQVCANSTGNIYSAPANMSNYSW